MQSKRPLHILGRINLCSVVYHLSHCSWSSCICRTQIGMLYQSHYLFCECLLFILRSPFILVSIFTNTLVKSEFAVRSMAAPCIGPCPSSSHRSSAEIYKWGCKKISSLLVEFSGHSLENGIFKINVLPTTLSLFAPIR